MRQLDLYILEKLKLNKDTKVDENDKCLVVRLESDQFGLSMSLHMVFFIKMDNGILTYDTKYKKKNNLQKSSINGFELNSNNIYEKYNTLNNKFDILLPTNIAITFLNDILDGKKRTKDILLSVFDKEDEFINDHSIYKKYSIDDVEKYLNDLTS